jgi:hypothetical protein
MKRSALPLVFGVYGLVKMCLKSATERGRGHRAAPSGTIVFARRASRAMRDIGPIFSGERLGQAPRLGAPIQPFALSVPAHAVHIRPRGHVDQRSDLGEANGMTINLKKSLNGAALSSEK